MQAQILQEYMDRKEAEAVARGMVKGLAKGRAKGIAKERMEGLLAVASYYLSDAVLASCRTMLATRTADQMPPAAELLQVIRTAEHPGRVVEDFLRHPWAPGSWPLPG